MGSPFRNPAGTRTIVKVCTVFFSIFTRWRDIVSNQAKAASLKLFSINYSVIILQFHALDSELRASLKTRINTHIENISTKYVSLTFRKQSSVHSMSVFRIMLGVSKNYFREQHLTDQAFVTETWCVLWKARTELNQCVFRLISGFKCCWFSHVYCVKDGVRYFIAVRRMGILLRISISYKVSI